MMSESFQTDLVGSYTETENNGHALTESLYAL
jgi:hypothetical protein